jgi:anti-anti-sigma factor
METIVEKLKDYTIYRIREDLQPLYDYKTVHRGLTKLVDDGHKNIAVDLSQVKYMYSDVATAFISAQNRIKDQGSFCLFGLNAEVRDTMEMLGLEDFIKVYHDEEDFKREKMVN